MVEEDNDAGPLKEQQRKEREQQRKEKREREQQIKAEAGEGGKPPKTGKPPKAPKAAKTVKSMAELEYMKLHQRKLSAKILIHTLSTSSSRHDMASCDAMKEYIKQLSTSEEKLEKAYMTGESDGGVESILAELSTALTSGELAGLAEEENYMNERIRKLKMG